MKTLFKILSVNFLIIAIMLSYVVPSHSQETKEMVEQIMPVLKGDTWVNMNQNEKISFLWGAGHVLTIQYVLKQKYPEQIKDDIFLTKIVEARENKPMTMNEVSKHVDDFYSKNPDKHDTPVMEVIWEETIVPNLTQTGNQ